jgi:hypothetical protein
VGKGLEIGLCAGVEPAKDLGVELGDARRGLAQLGLRGRVEPERRDQIGDGALDAGGARGCPWAQDPSAWEREKGADRGRPPKMERKTGFEPATSTLARWRSTGLSYFRAR